MNYFEDLESTNKLFDIIDKNYRNYIVSEILKFYEKNDYYMFKNFVEHNYSKFLTKNLSIYSKTYKLLERLHIEINSYLFTPYTTFSSGCKDFLQRIKENYK